MDSFVTKENSKNTVNEKIPEKSETNMENNVISDGKDLKERANSIRKEVETGKKDLSDEDTDIFMKRYCMTPEKYLEWKESLKKYKDNPRANPMYYIHPPFMVIEEDSLNQV